MKILWVTYDLPFPSNSGGKLRAYHLLKGVAVKHKLTLYSYYRDEDQLAFLPEIKSFVPTIKVFKRRPVWDGRNLLKTALSSWPLLSVSYLDRYLQAAIGDEVRRGNYDLIHLEFFGVAWLLPFLKDLGQKVVLGEENVEYEIYRRYAARMGNWPLRCLLSYDVWKMRRQEEKFWRLADAVLAVSQADGDVIVKTGARNCFLVPNGVDVAFYRRFVKKVDEGSGRRALFTGNLNYPQNGEAIRWFLTAVAPLIRQEVPDFRLIVVSQFRPAWIGRFSDLVDFRVNDRTDFTAFVDQADVFVLPVWIKSGTNIKLLQAAAVGFPVVTTSAGLAGYDFVNGRDLVCADGGVSFAAGVVSLLRDSAFRKRLSESIRHRVEKYDWRFSVRSLETVYEKVQLS